VPEHGPILDWFDFEPMLGAELRRADDAKRTHCTGSIELLPAHRPGPQQLTVGVRGGEICVGQIPSRSARTASSYPEEASIVRWWVLPIFTMTNGIPNVRQHASAIAMTLI
jgi:hypothetical protein